MDLHDGAEAVEAGVTVVDEGDEVAHVFDDAREADAWSDTRDGEDHRDRQRPAHVLEPGPRWSFTLADVADYLP